MISFYPGPSRVHDEIPQYVHDAYQQGILSINHRSDEFMAISASVVRLLKDKLGIPEEYTVFYTSSATECWEIIAQSVIGASSLHVFNGAFGKKWYEYTRRLCSGADSFPFQPEHLINPEKLNPENNDTVICLTQNETSNGTQVSQSTLRELREHYPSHLVAIDATSSMAGIVLDFSAADLWFASVQKCFGLPAGLGIMVCSPATMARVKKKNEHNHYNSLSFMAEMMERYQTPFTPNVLNIYLLMRVLENSENIPVIHNTTETRYSGWIDFFSEKQTIQHLIANKAAHSFTVIPVKASPEVVTSIKSKAKAQGFLLGEGYGDLKASTFRIANFPALKEAEIDRLKQFLSHYN